MTWRSARCTRVVCRPRRWSTAACARSFRAQLSWRGAIRQCRTKPPRPRWPNVSPPYGRGHRHRPPHPTGPSRPSERPPPELRSKRNARRTATIAERSSRRNADTRDRLDVNRESLPPAFFASWRERIPIMVGRPHKLPLAEPQRSQRRADGRALFVHRPPRTSSFPSSRHERRRITRNPSPPCGGR